MRYHFEKPAVSLSMYGRRYICNHPVYDSCTLFEIDEKGLAVIQQRFDPKTKSTSWTEVDAYLTDVLYLHPKFKEFFDSRARTCTDGLYSWRFFVIWSVAITPATTARPTRKMTAGIGRPPCFPSFWGLTGTSGTGADTAGGGGSVCSGSRSGIGAVE